MHYLYPFNFQPASRHESDRRRDERREKDDKREKREKDEKREKPNEEKRSTSIEEGEIKTPQKDAGGNC